MVSPIAYTKLSCFLPWVAEQYGLSYEDRSADDEACTRGTGQKPPYDAVCRESKGSSSYAASYELPCIFPFYYKGQGPFDRCSLFDRQYYDVPVWRCPVRNITTKFPGTDINHFEEDIGLYCLNIELAIATCDPDLVDGGPDCRAELDPNIDCEPYLKARSLSTCKSDCPGGKYLPSHQISKFPICN